MQYLKEILKFALEEAKDAAPKDTRIVAEVSPNLTYGTSTHQAVNLDMLLTVPATGEKVAPSVILLGFFIESERDPGEDWLRTTIYQKVVETLLADLGLQLTAMSTEGRVNGILREMVEKLEQKRQGFLNPSVVLTEEDFETGAAFATDGNRFEMQLPPIQPDEDAVE